MDCIIMRQRLLYVSRIVSNRPAALVALLCVRRRGRGHPWVAQVHNDLQTLYDCASIRPQLPLPNPDVGAEQWQAWIMDNAERWKTLLRSLFFTASVG